MSPSDDRSRPPARPPQPRGSAPSGPARRPPVTRPAQPMEIPEMSTEPGVDILSGASTLVYRDADATPPNGHYVEPVISVAPPKPARHPTGALVAPAPVVQHAPPTSGSWGQPSFGGFSESPLTPVPRPRAHVTSSLPSMPQPSQVSGDFSSAGFIPPQAFKAPAPEAARAGGSQSSVDMSIRVRFGLSGATGGAVLGGFLGILNAMLVGMTVTEGMPQTVSLIALLALVLGAIAFYRPQRVEDLLVQAHIIDPGDRTIPQAGTERSEVLSGPPQQPPTFRP